MSEIWNEADLKRPAVLTVEVGQASFIVKLHRTLTKLIQNDQTNTEFSETAALLSRLIARRKNSFRRMIGFRALLKLNSAVARLLRVDLQRDLESFYGILPDMVFGKKEIASLPTQNYLDFILLRLLTVYNIHERIHDCSGNAAAYFTELMRANNFLDLNVILVSVLAKLRSLNKILGRRTVNIYNALMEKRALFPLGKQKRAFEIDLPAQLNEFQSPAVEVTTQMATPLILDNDKVTAKQTMISLKTKKTPKSADIGTEVERKQHKKVPKQEKEFNIEQLKTTEDVKRFITVENKARLKSLDRCTTKKIQNHIWTGAQKIFERKIQSGEEKKALNVFRKFLSSNL